MQFAQDLEAHVPAADIVERDAHAERAQLRRPFDDRPGILDEPLTDLDHDLIGP